MPNLLIVSQLYKPSHDAGSKLLAELAEELVYRDIGVYVLTSATNYMTGENLPLFETLDDVRVWRVPTPPVSKKSTLGKGTLYASFLLQSVASFVLLPSVDVVMILSTPPLLSWTSLLLKPLGIHSIFLVQDVYPELMIQMGYLKNRRVKEMLAAFDKATLSRFSRVVVLGERMKERIIAKGVSPEKVVIIENWQAGPVVFPLSDRPNAFVARHGLDDSFVVQYSGNMGIAHDFVPVIEAARILKSNRQIKFVLIGEGKRRREVEEMVKQNNLDNVLLLPYQPISLLPEVLSSAHLSLVSLRPQLEGLAVPSKLYGILAAGTPVIFIGDSDGEVARVIRRGDCGVTVDNGVALARRILELRDDERRRSEMAINARRIYEREFERKKAIDKYEKLIRELSP